eukprot:TRINITY_DN7415_c0_g1_i5.p1 TRINITY_DN7415_c0_g1~~TRINITY_DN7415_c0_g1_i5.p1  ORF type:complete len:599 (+),score=114.26 TRINITY_DN7415_c0_g1_i5:65-1861(+)
MCIRDRVSTQSTWETRMAESLLKPGDLTSYKRISKYREASVYWAKKKESDDRFGVKMIRGIENNEIDSLIPGILKSTKMDENPYALKLYGYEKLENKDEITEETIPTLSLVTELFDKSLDDHLRKRTKPTREDADKVLGLLLKSLKEMQEKGISHKNIKPGNIFIYNDYQDIKFGDFGELSLRVFPTLLLASDNTYRIKYMAPEIRLFLPQFFEAIIERREWKDVKDYNPHKADVFSVGLTLVEILTLENAEFAFIKGRRGSFIDHNFLRDVLENIRVNYNEKLFITIAAMLIPDPHDRPDFLKLYEEYNKDLSTIKKNIEVNGLKNRILDPSFHSNATGRPPNAPYGQFMPTPRGPPPPGLKTPANQLAFPQQNFEQEKHFKLLIDEDLKIPTQTLEGWKNTRTYFDVLNNHQELLGLKLNLSNASLLFLANKEITFPDIKYLASHLSKMKSLIFLDLSLWGQWIGDEGLQQLACTLMYMDTLKHLRLRLGINCLSDTSVIQLADCLSYLKDIESLSLNIMENQVSQSGVNKICDSFLKLPNLRILNFCCISNPLDAQPTKFLIERLRTSRAVSYTHLRAHETDSYLVCRLLLEKKK